MSEAYNNFIVNTIKEKSPTVASILQKEIK